MSELKCSGQDPPGGRLGPQSWVWGEAVPHQVQQQLAPRAGGHQVIIRAVNRTSRKKVLKVPTNTLIINNLLRCAKHVFKNLE